MNYSINSQESQVISVPEMMVQLANAGVSFVPVGSDKLPAFNLLPIETDEQGNPILNERGNPKHEWTRFQSEIPSAEWIRKWRNAWGLAIIGGKVSGNLFCVDFEAKDHNQAPMECVYQEWKRLVKAERKSDEPPYLFPISKTMSGGIHVRWRVEGDYNLVNEKLSFAWSGDTKNGKPIANCLIEAKAEGGYALCPPSPGYEMVQGDLTQIPTISIDLHERLVAIAKSFHTAITPTVESMQSPPRQQRERTEGELMPGEDYNLRGDHHIPLNGAGWTLAHISGETEYWKHPTTDNRWSATFNAVKCPNLFWTWSPNTPFQPEKGYSKFAVFAILKHDGDFSAAARDLYQQGFGTRHSSPPQRTETARLANDLGEPSITPPAREITHFVTEDEPDDERIIRTPSAFADVPLDLSSIVPKQSWIRMYLDYLRPTIDAPEQFGIATGISCLSMFCRDMHIWFGQMKIRPNIWLAIVAPSTRYRKSVSIRIARDLMQAVEPGIKLPSSYSPSSLFDRLLENPAGIFVWGEMGGALRAFDKSHMSGFKEELTDLFECPPTWERNLRGSGNEKVENPFVGILAASTQDWLYQCLSEGDLKGGFLPRFLWVMAFSKSRFLDWPESPDPIMKENLANLLHQLTGMFQGGMTIDPEAKDTCRAYFRKLDQESQASGEMEGILAAFYGRLQDYVLKFALVYQADLQLMNYPDNPQRIITPEATEYAIALAEYLKGSISYFLNDLSYNDLMANRVKVLKMVQVKPGITRSDLLRHSRLAKKDFDEAILTLIESEQIVGRSEQKTRKSSVCYYPLATDDNE